MLIEKKTIFKKEKTNTDNPFTYMSLYSLSVEYIFTQIYKTIDILFFYF